MKEITHAAPKIAETTVQAAELGEFAWRKFLPLAFGGHCYYVRQDVTPDAGGIVMPDAIRDRSVCVTVLGVGPKVGTKADKTHRMEYEWPGPFAFVSGVKPGDRLLLAFERGQWGLVTTTKIKRSPWNWDCELFIEETLPDAIVEDA